MKRTLLSWVLLPIIAAIVVVVDQWSKGWIESNIPVGDMWAPIPALESYFKFTHLTNTGAAFGILQGQASLFIMIAVVVILAVLAYAHYLPADNWAVRACLGLQLGGATGNLVDRLEHGGRVTDWALFSVPWRGGELMWPAFNVADSCIVVGVILLAIVLLRGDNEGPVAQTAPTETAAVGEEGRSG